MRIRIENLNDINRAARQFIAQLPPDTHVIAFYGSMGAGKTTFIKALCEELGVTDVITSPTFAIVNEYQANAPLHPEKGEAARVFPIYHFDFYRIRRLEEVYDMGYEEYFYAPDTLSLIEWPELAESLLPDNTLRVSIEEQPDGSRSITSLA